MIRLENVLKTSLQDVFDDVLKKYSKRLEDVFARRLQDVLKTSWRNIENGSWRRLADVWPKRIYWSGPRRLGDVLKSSSEDVCLMRINLSSSRVLKTSSEDEDKRGFQDVFMNTNFWWKPTKFHCQLAFTSWNIGQYVYYNWF